MILKAYTTDLLGNQKKGMTSLSSETLSISLQEYDENDDTEDEKSNEGISQCHPPQVIEYEDRGCDHECEYPEHENPGFCCDEDYSEKRDEYNEYSPEKGSTTTTT